MPDETPELPWGRDLKLDVYAYVDTVGEARV
jgi:hypothetical protein